MKRALPWINLGGALLLAVLCALQWNLNRRLNLEVNNLEKTRIQQTQQLADQDKALKGAAADLDSFRQQIQAGSAALKEAESGLRAVQRENGQLQLDVSQLKESLAKWTAAVRERDEQLSQTREQMRELAESRNEAVLKFNELAAKYGEAVQELNARTTNYNALVERYNALAKQVEQAAK